MTTVRLDRAPSTASVGGQWALSLTTYDVDGNASSVVAPVVTVTRPDASTTTVTPTDNGTGSWTAVYTLAAAGRHLVAVSTPEDVAESAVYAYGPTTEAGMPTTDDCVHYMQTSSYTTADVADALAAERAAQRARCGEREPYPPDLRQALLRRVQRNLAMRRLPLAVNFGDADGGPLVLPGRDPEVRRLENPYRRLVVG